MSTEANRVDTLVVKVGTALLTPSGDRFDEHVAESIVDQLARLVKSGVRTILVSSGAIGGGMSVLGISQRPDSLPMKQATAAIGQSRLMRLYDELFDRHGLHVAQILVTASDLADRHRYLNLRNTLQSLLQLGNVVPVINENDSIAVEEIQFGDNDTLAAMIASKMAADMLVLLTDVDGLYTSAPKGNKRASKLVVVLPRITPAIEKMAAETQSERSVGGMTAKLEAAKIATRSGVRVVIANGRRENVIEDVLAKQAIATFISPRPKSVSSRKRWIAFGMKSRGKIVIDAGAVAALKTHGKSLLPSGILSVEGTFKLGDPVTVVSEQGEDVAQGLANYSADDVKRIMGMRTSEIESVLGRKDYDEVIHRDNLVTF